MNNFGRFSQAKINLLYSAGASPRPTNEGVMLAYTTVERTMFAPKKLSFESFLVLPFFQKR